MIGLRQESAMLRMAFSVKAPGCPDVPTRMVGDTARTTSLSPSRPSESRSQAAASPSGLASWRW